MEVVSLIQSPAAIPDNAFCDKTYTDGTLYVPEGTMARYMVRDGWKNFAYMKEGVPSAISSVNACTNERARYTLDGWRTTTSQRGLNIIRMSDGTVRKVMVRSATK